MSPDHAVSTVSVVVPVYNSEATLGELVSRLTRVLEGAAAAYEILLVNDGSRDGSWSAIEALVRQVPHLRGIDLARNCGQHNALLCGIRAARFDVVVTLDDDLQNRPEDIPAMLERLRAGGDVVYGVPTKRRWGLVRNTASHLMKLALRTTMSASTAEIVGGFRAFRTPVREAFADYRAPITNIDVMLTWGASRFAAVPVVHEPRRAGRSGYSYYRLFVHTWNMATGFSTLPLQIATGIGFSFTLVGIATLLFVLLRYWMFGAVVQGFTFLTSIISIYAGAQLFAIGIIGEYLGRMFQRTSGQPGYVVRQQAGAP
ncbi:MAG TPA: glycosyltransferase family 2 protein [Vicinamibacterales bacterium]|nr:glycosyltransferase family 2 protein [Vicinamibacterales bacterium]